MSKDENVVIISSTNISINLTGMDRQVRKCEDRNGWKAFVYFLSTEGCVVNQHIYDTRDNARNAVWFSQIGENGRIA